MIPGDKPDWRGRPPLSTIGRRYRGVRNTPTPEMLQAFLYAWLSFNRGRRSTLDQLQPLLQKIGMPVDRMSKPGHTVPITATWMLRHLKAWLARGSNRNSLRPDDRYLVVHTASPDRHPVYYLKMP